MDAVRLFKRYVMDDKNIALKKLLETTDVDVNMERGWALIYSIKNDCMNSFKVLVNHPEIDLNIRNGEALVQALEYENFRMFNLLLKNGASVSINPRAILSTVKEVNEPRFKRVLVKNGFTYLYSNIPSYIEF